MTPTGRKLRLSVQTKVLIPVLVFLVLLPVITVLIVDKRIDRLARNQASDALATANGVFQRLLQIQQRDLLTRYQNLAGDQRLQIILHLPSAAEHAQDFENTIQYFLNERLEEYGEDTSVIVFTSNRTAAPVGVTRQLGIKFDDFVRAAAGITNLARTGEMGVAGTASLDNAAFYVVALPVIPQEGGQAAGVLTIGVRISEAALQELKKVTRTDIFLITNGQMITSTVPGQEARLLPQIALGGPPAADSVQSRAIEINGEHFLALTGAYDLVGGQRGFQYVLLYSMEESRKVVQETQQILAAVGAIGVLLSAFVVWLFVRRIIHPLRELRDMAEAVGRGDFSRKVGRVSNDECGDLADAFNGMTANLQSSRAELEKAVETLKATQAQLIQSEKLSAVGQFVAGVAHELNNPLAAVIGFSDLLCQTGTDPAVRSHLELIAKSAHRCHKIVQNLLSFARQHPPERSLVQLNGVIDEVLEIMAYEFRTSNITIVRQFEGNLPVITADPHQLQQVFVNILGNARQAVEAFRPDGQIVVRTRVEGRFVRVEFTDNGPGIRPENLSRIFDPFFTTKPVGKGTGLGLSLSYGMIQEHGGRISARSELGNGATFEIDLPVAAEAAAPGRELPRPATIRPKKAAGSSGRKILVVDDEEWILALARELLQNAGHEVETVLGGEQAITALRRRKFDVVVCDWKMPGLNGINFYEHLLATDPTMADRVLFMSGDIINDTFQDFLRRHGKTCLPKPFPIDEFQNAVAAMLK